MNRLRQTTRGHDKGTTKVFGFLVPLCCLMLAGLLFSAEQTTASDIALLVPAYANPCCAGGPDMWAKLINTAQTTTVGLNVIVNPYNGPGLSQIDLNYVNASGQGPLVDLWNAGAMVFGYVPTTYRNRDITAVKTDVDTYYDPNYWRGSGIQVDGIFFDEMSNDLAHVWYYQELRAYVKLKDPAAKVIANPGTTSTKNPSMQMTFTVTDYAQSADTIVTFENTGIRYRTTYTPPSWLNDFTADHFAHIIHTESASANMRIDVSLARARKAGMVYITDDIRPTVDIPDDVFEPRFNPYDMIASYWTDEVSAIEEHPPPPAQDCLNECLSPCTRCFDGCLQNFFQCPLMPVGPEPEPEPCSAALEECNTSCIGICNELRPGCVERCSPSQ